MRFVCPSCGAANSVPDAAAGYTITCCQCKTEITVPELSGPPVWGLGTVFWRVALAIEAVVAAAAMAAWIVFFLARPPADLPLVGSPRRLAAPGREVILRWESGLESAGGFFELTSSQVRLDCNGQTMDLRGAKVAEKRWDFPIFEHGRTPPFRPLGIEVAAPLPCDQSLAGHEATVVARVSIEYPGRPAPTAEPRLMRAELSHKWAFRLATAAEEAAYSAWRWRRLGLWAGAWVALVLALATPVLAWLKARRVLNVMCPKCGRVAVVRYLWGTRHIELSPCPHYDQRPRRDED